MRPAGALARPPGPPSGFGQYGSPPMRPMNANPGQGYPADYPRAPVRQTPPSYNGRQDGMAQTPTAQGLGMGAPRPFRPPPPPPAPPLQQQQQQQPVRYSTQSLSGWEHGPSQHPSNRPPPSSWNDPGTQNGSGSMNHRRATSTQLQPTYYGSSDMAGLDRQASVASRYNNGASHPAGPYTHNPAAQQYQHQQQPPYMNTSNRQLVRHKLSDPPIPSPTRQHNGGPGGPEGYYYPNAPYRKLSIGEGMDGARISLDSTASVESGYTNRQPSLYPVPNVYSRDADPSLDSFSPNRQRSASKSSTYSGHSVHDYYADFDSGAAPRSATPNGSTPQISIQSAQGFPTGRTDPFSMRARTPSPGRARQGSNPPSARTGAFL